MSDQSVPPASDAAERVESSGVRLRAKPRPVPARSTYAALGLVLALAAGGLLVISRMSSPGDTAEATGQLLHEATATVPPQPASTSAVIGPTAAPSLPSSVDRASTDPGATESPATDRPDPTTVRSDPTDPPAPTRKPSPKPTRDPPDPPDPTPSPTPPPSFSVALEDRCLDVNGDEQVMVRLEWVSAKPPITEIQFFMDGTLFGSHSGFSEVNSWVASSYPLAIGTTHVGGGKFYANGVLVEGLVESKPWTVKAGAPCPTG